MDNNGRLKIFSWLILGACVVGIGLWQGVLSQRSGVVEPLALANDETIWGHLRVEAIGPEAGLTIGAPLLLTLEVEAQTGVAYDLPDLSAVWPDDFLELAETLPEQAATLPGGSRKSRQYRLIAWRSGKFTLPKLSIPYQEDGEKRGEYLIPGQVFVVESLLPAQSTPAERLTLDLKGPKKPAGLPLPYHILYGHLGAALLILIGAGLLRRIRQARLVSSLERQTPPPPEPAHMAALRQLEVLKTSPYLDNNDFPAFYTELSQCLRRYMADRYGINALEMTTEEFLTWVITGRWLLNDQQLVVREVLRLSDLVKFAKTGSTSQEALRTLAQLEQFILDTLEVETADKELPDLSGPWPKNGDGHSEVITPDGGTTE